MDALVVNERRVEGNGGIVRLYWLVGHVWLEVEVEGDFHRVETTPGTAAEDFWHVGAQVPDLCGCAQCNPRLEAWHNFDETEPDYPPAGTADEAEIPFA